MQSTKSVSVLLFTTVLSFIFLAQLLTSFQLTASSSQPLAPESQATVINNQDSDCTLIKWFDPNTNEKEGKLLLKNCSSCHMTYYNEWIVDKHSMSQNNPLFLAIYKQFREDHPEQNGNCSLCHNPEAALDNNFDVDLRRLKSKKTNGISCDFCHKIESVDQDRLKKGVAGLKILRICKGQRDIRFGPIKDPIQPGDKEELKYNSLYKTSLSCAKCHDGLNKNVQIYSTFTEWVNSPAAKRGVQCQSCHMQPRKRTGEENYIVDNLNIKRKRRPYHQIHSHSFLTEDPHKFRKKYVDLKVGFVKVGLKPNSTASTGGHDILTVTCKVENNNFGHSFPTGSPMRNAILILDVKCINDKGEVTSLQQIRGSRLPNYAGDLRNKPGKLFAKILSETSGEYATKHGKAGILFRKIASELGIPAQDWWNVYISQDTRIKANEEDVSVYKFSVGTSLRGGQSPTKQSPISRNEIAASVPSEPSRNDVIEVTAKLIWRNTWPGLAKIKKIELKEDLLIEKQMFLTF